MTELPPLARVEVIDLVKAPELNGQHGTVLGPQGKRYLVRLDGTNQAKALMRDNLVLAEGGLAPLSHVEITGLVGSAELNGKHGVVMGKHGLRYLVQADATGQTKALKAENLQLAAELPPKTSVTINGLQGTPELNGTHGVVLGRQGLRYMVSVVEQEQVKSFRYTNLAVDPKALAPGESPLQRLEAMECLICHNPLWGEDGKALPGQAVADLVCHHLFHSKCLEMHQQSDRHASVFGDRRCCPVCGMSITFWGAWKEVRTKWQAPCYWAGRLYAVLCTMGPALEGVPWNDLLEAVRCAEGLSQEELQEALHGHKPPFTDHPSPPAVGLAGRTAACCKVALTGSALQKALDVGAHPRVRVTSENDWQGMPSCGPWHVLMEGRVVGGVLPKGSRVFFRPWGLPPDSKCTKCRRSLHEGWLLCDGPCRTYIDTLYCSAECRGQDLKAHSEVCDCYRKPSWEAPAAELKSV